jgi:hypothetical protein
MRSCNFSEWCKHALLYIHWPLSFFISQMIAALVINRAKNPPNGRLCKCSLTLALKFEAMVVSSTNKHESKRTGVSSKLEPALLNPGKVASGVSYRVHGTHVNFVRKSAQPVRGTLALGGAQRTQQIRVGTHPTTTAFRSKRRRSSTLLESNIGDIYCFLPSCRAKVSVPRNFVRPHADRSGQEF